MVLNPPGSPEAATPIRASVIPYPCPADRLKQPFPASRSTQPSILTWQGWVDTAFMIDLFSSYTLMTICTFQSTIDREVFNAWVTQDLLPKTSAGTVIVMDNASFHKKEATKRAIALAGCTLEFLPTYSPDLNPIEHKWAQAKAIRRKLRRSVDEIFQQAFI